MSWRFFVYFLRMDNRLNYWNEQWAADKHPWHKPIVNDLLKKHFVHIFSKHTQTKPCRIFVPLCGKTLDLKWYAMLYYYLQGKCLNVDVAN